MKRIWLIPLGLFVVLLGFLGVGLTHDPHRIPSPLIGRAAPSFELQRLNAPGQSVSPADFKGRVWLLNVWASWCDSCREEHPLLLQYAHRQHVPLVGLDYKDSPVDARHWLAEAGDPYDMVGVDADGHVGINYGVYGVPETYLIDRQGNIVYKQIGPITPEVLKDRLLPLIRKLSS
ncbi:DsbE family thiol:disulfide interchange protein [Thiomonas sp.]|jgi:cytochrome c biogenesis protein CcmG/thiol:disulfide interchange protein DsbE|uniref:DsbE family thiol:disulfide interchange protein n=1 Tax=Thiomonas sp. TaxID=2047785 RepID=UPI002629B0D0|nr:DsbE family thiol:disulfide interchange protein [Thiomonas sp.]